MFKTIITFCSSLLVSSDLFQFKNASLEYLCKERSKLEAKRRWKKLTEDDEEVLSLIAKEFELREVALMPTDCENNNE